MKPLLFADWRTINRAFCFFTWIVALALALVIVAHYVSGSTACAGTAHTPHPRACVAEGGHLRPIGR